MQWPGHYPAAAAHLPGPEADANHRLYILQPDYQRNQRLRLDSAAGGTGARKATGPIASIKAFPALRGLTSSEQLLHLPINDALSDEYDQLQAAKDIFERMLNHPDFNYPPFPVFTAEHTQYDVWDWIWQRLSEHELPTLDLGRAAILDDGEESGAHAFSLVSVQEFQQTWDEMLVEPLEWLDVWRQRNNLTDEEKLMQRIIALMVMLSNEFISCPALQPYFEDMCMDYIRQDIEEQKSMLDNLEKTWKEKQHTLSFTLREGDAVLENSYQVQKEQYEEEESGYYSKIADYEEALAFYKHGKNGLGDFESWLSQQAGRKVYTARRKRLTRLLQQLEVDSEASAHVHWLGMVFESLATVATREDGSRITMDDFIKDRGDDDRTSRRRYREGLSPRAIMGFWYTTDACNDALVAEINSNIDCEWANEGQQVPTFTVDLLNPKLTLRDQASAPEFPRLLEAFMVRCHRAFKKLTTLYSLPYDM